MLILGNDVEELSMPICMNKGSKDNRKYYKNLQKQNKWTEWCTLLLKKLNVPPELNKKYTVGVEGFSTFIGY